MSSTPESSVGPDAPRRAGVSTAVHLLRQQLIDTGKRNRLTNAPVGKGRSRAVDIEDEIADEVFRILYLRSGKMTFKPQRHGSAHEALGESESDESDAEVSERVFVPGDEEPAGTVGATSDTKLQSRSERRGASEAAADAVPRSTDDRKRNGGQRPLPGLGLPALARKRVLRDRALFDAEAAKRVSVSGDEEPAETAVRHTDTKLQTSLNAEALQKRLLTLYREARTIEDEQGISVLFLGLGFLRWYESTSSEIERFAPLILLPVDLQRDSVRGRFELAHRDQDMEPNLSLRAMLKQDFDLTLPDFPDDPDWLPSQYFELIAKAVSSQPRWEVRPNLIELSFYSFAKFLMWKDLEAVEGDEGKIDPLLANLLVGGFELEPPIFAPDENLDRRFPDPRDIGHIMDADTSQTQVIEAARKGRNLVVQGPPGTGKSQTIANIIAGAVNDGKKVLFVAEKRVALDVVHSRLEKCGLGPLCLELHSHKANRKGVYADLKYTLELGEPTAVNDAHYERVRAVRDDLNRISELLHCVDRTVGETAYGIIGLLGKLSAGGLPVPDFQIAGCGEWSRAEYGKRLDAVVALAEKTREFGREREHIWRGASTRIGPIERQRLAERLPLAVERLSALQAALEIAASAAGVADPSRFSAVRQASDQLVALKAMPDAVLGLLESDALVERPAEALALCVRAAELQELKSGLLAEVVESALEVSWDEARLEIGAGGRSLFRWFNGRYRNAMARLRSVQRGKLPKQHEARLALLDRLIEHRNRKHALDQESHFGQKALGPVWKDEDTAFEALFPALRWIASQAETLGSATAVRKQTETIPADCDFAGLLRNLRRAFDEWTKAWEPIQNGIDLEIATAFGADHIDVVECEALKNRLRVWSSDTASIEDWSGLRSAARHASELGMDEIRERLADGRLAPNHARSTLEFVRAEAVWNRMRRNEPQLDTIDGRYRSEKVAEFKKLDRQLQELASQEIALKHFNSLPRGSAGMVGIVLGETNKKARHMRLRKLLDTAPDAVAAIKPVFLMSPLSVAQYLSLGKLTFDLLLIDEASQVRPADAMGAILRAKQIIVVGDRKQMPPTSFFDREVSGDDGADLEDTADIQAGQVGDMESILSLCEARGMSGGLLRWHYRSRHPSLIAVSNHEFYDDGLVCPPSPDSVGPSMGFSFTHVHGEYQRGKKRNNPKEAQAVADQVLAHARECPGETLGVVALSVAQRDTVLNKLEIMRAEFPELDAFCREGNEDPFFVKNLENVQGDERDAIFISVGYGKDAEGYMSQNFGPVSIEGGERRLNVLFTRAKRQCRVFASIRHSDIRLDAIRHAGPRVLKRFLKYAETGEMDVPQLTGAPMDSPFEEDVAHQLQLRGHRVEPQVGSSGFKIDLAVRDPDDESRFLLAVECDGARYHSSSWARERDRLRQTVLEQKGWTFHRIWSTDWFYKRDVELRKLLDAVERARLNRPRERKVVPVPTKAVTVERAERTSETEPERVAYREADFWIPERELYELHEASAAVLHSYIARIVEEEGPVHIDEVARRLSRLWGYKRLGKRIQEAVESAVRAATRRGLIRYADDGRRQFLERREGTVPVVVRDRSNAGSTLRKKDMLPPSEIEAAVQRVVESSIGIGAGDCAVEVARLFGCKSSADLCKHFEIHARKMVSQGRLTVLDGHLRLP